MKISFWKILCAVLALALLAIINFSLFLLVQSGSTDPIGVSELFIVNLSTLALGALFALIIIFRLNRRVSAGSMSKEEEIFRLAVEGTKDGVFDWNIKTDDVYYSEQFFGMLGYSSDEFSGSLNDFSERLHPDDRESVWKQINLYLDGKLSEYSVTFRMQHKSGRWVWIRSRGILILDDKQMPARFVGAHTDISAAKEYEAKLRQAMLKAEAANEAKSEFLAHMSHEIRTPLTAITGATEILMQNIHELDEKRQKLINVLHGSSISLKDLISDILDFSKIESGELELEMTAFRLQDAFEHVTSIMSVRTSEKELDYIFDYENVGNLEFYGDPSRIRQILINLIGNAIKFTEKGHVQVKASTEDQGEYSVLRVDVEDTGIGIDQSQLDLIFEQFKQADSTMSRKYGGTGLGLPISKKLAHLMGGNIEVRSEPGKGSTFSLVVPLMSSSNPPSENDASDDTARKKRVDEFRAQIGGFQKALLVEDYDGNITVLGHILADMNIEYDIARTGAEAVQKWKENHYGLILMDIQMPEMDGFTSTRLIRKIEKEKELEPTPIVGMTAHALVGDKDSCLDAGMNDYLPKPIVERNFKSMVLTYIESHQGEAEGA